MAQQLISVGTLANDNTGDTLRDAFIKTNANFSEIYTGNPTLTGSPTLSPSGNGSVTITNAGTSSALRITQTGSGNALLVEDETNPDTTPFTITALGRVGIGTTSPESNFHMYAVDTGLNPFFERNEDGVGGVSLTGRRSRGTVSAKTALTNGDVIGGYAALGYDGANYQFRGGFRFIVDGAVSANNVPTSLVLETGTTTSPIARITIDSAGRVGIGSSTANSSDLRINKATTGNINQYGVLAEFTTQSDVTNAQYGFTTSLATQATSFTLANLRHFAAVFQSIGAGSTVTNQVGFFAGSSLIGAANNYGFYSDIASGSNRWNFYANGTATNYFAGNVFIGNTNSGGTERLFVEQTADAHTARIVNTSTSGALRGLQIHSTANNIPGVTMSRWYSSFAGNADVGQVRFDGLGTGGAYVEHAAIYAIATGANTATGAPTKLSFKTSDGSASVERMAISGTGVVSAVANITSTSTTTGSLIVTGGTGISENLWVGGYINVDNLRLQDNTLSSTNANGNIVLAPNGTGDVQLDADTVRVGDSNAAVTLTTNGAAPLTINTGVVGATATGNTIAITGGLGGATSGAGGAVTVQAGSAQTLGAGGALNLYGGAAVGTNQAGADVTIRAGNGTGTAGSGSIILQTAAAGTTGTTANTLTTRVTVAPVGSVTLAANVTSTSTTSGTLIVTGGVGVSENLWVGGYINVDNLRLQDNTLSSTNTDGNIVLAPNGAGDVQLDADTVRIGDSGAAATLTTNGAGNLTIRTGSTNSGSILINQGDNGNIDIEPHGTGDVNLNADTVRVGDSNAAATVTTNGTGNLTVRTGSTNSGSILINQGDNGVISIQTHGTGEVVINDAGNAADFRVEGDTDANLLIADASVDRVGIGINAPATKLHIQQTNAATNSVTRLLRIDNYSTGTPANGIGVGLEFGVETTDNNLEIGAAIEAVVTDVTATSEDFDIVFRTMGAGAAAAERVRISSNTTSTSTTTGALVVSGGIGVADNVYVSKALVVGTTLSTATALDLNNNNIIGVNNLTFADPGPNEGISFNGNFTIYESPDDLVTNTGGNLQFVSGAARRLTVKTSGQVEIPATTASTSTTTGALIVGGGVGASGAIRAGGEISIEGGQFISVSGPSGGTRIRRDGGLNGLDLQTASTSRLFISDSGPVTITSTTASTSTTTGALIVGGGVGIAGALNATTKSFIIDHPTKPGKLLRHGSLEGPEFGVYVRGKLNGNVIELPEYWTKLVDPNSITVQLTPIGKHQKLYVEDIRDNKVYIGNEGLFSGEAHCFYYVQGERIDVDKLEVESE